jgi:hypothetical protein
MRPWALCERRSQHLKRAHVGLTIASASRWPSSLLPTSASSPTNALTTVITTVVPPTALGSETGHSVLRLRRRIDQRSSSTQSAVALRVRELRPKRQMPTAPRWRPHDAGVLTPLRAVTIVGGTKTNPSANPQAKPSIHREFNIVSSWALVESGGLGLRSGHLHVGDYVRIPALFIAGIDCGRGIAISRAVDNRRIRVQSACIQQ